MHHAYKPRAAAYQNALYLTAPDANRKFRLKFRLVWRACFFGDAFTALFTSRNILGW